MPSIGSKTNKLTTLRYAEWASLIDQKKSVTKFEFDVHDVSKLKDPQDAADDKYNSTKLVKVLPTYAYRNRRMTEKDLYNEMTASSEKWEDFRQDASLDRDEEAIGSAHVEVLACHGLVSECPFVTKSSIVANADSLLFVYSLNWTNSLQRMRCATLFVARSLSHQMLSTAS